ncbi:hypothetical protein QUB75_02165 [Microcoleus sp. K1-B6]
MDVRKKEEGRRKKEEGSWATDYVTDLSHMLHHSQLAFYEQARCLFHKI